MNPKFIKYEKNNDVDAKFLGIAIISLLDGKLVLRYKIQSGKNGGVFIAAMSTKQNDEWHQAFTIDSNIANEEIISLIKNGMNKSPSQLKVQSIQENFIDDAKCPF